MSIKIYNGFKIPEMTLGDLKKHITQLQESANALVKTKQDKYLGTRATTFLDRCTIFNQMGELEKSSAFSRAWAELQERQRLVKQTKRRDPDVDFEFELTFFPLHGCILGIYYCEHKDLARLWMQQPFVQEYGYWDNTDPADGVSEQEWSAREENWKTALLSSNGVPCQNGFSITITDSFYTPEIKNIIKHVPNLKIRATEFALDVMFQKFLTENPPNLENCESTITKYMEFEQWRSGTPEGRMEFESKADEIITKLNIVVTETDLLGRKIG